MKIKNWILENLLLVGFVCVLLAVGLCPTNPQRFISQASWGLYAGVFLLSYILYSRLGLMVGLNSLWVLGSGIVYFRNPKFYFGIFAELAQMAFTSIIGEALLWCVLGSVFALWLVDEGKRLTVALRALVVLFYADITWMIVRRFFDEEYHYRFLGMMDNEAVDSTLLIILYPLVMIRNKTPWWGHLLFGGFICLAGSTTAILGLGIIWATWFLLEWTGALWKKMALSLCSLLSIGALGWVYLGGQFWHSNGRLVVWKKSFDYWIRGAPIWRGTGVGTYYIYGPGIQLQDSVPGKTAMIFVWMHNEYLQVLFELGVIGLVLFLGLHVNILSRAYNRAKWLFYSCVAFAFIEGTQMPYRHSLTSIVGLVLLCLVLERHERTEIIS